MIRCLAETPNRTYSTRSRSMFLIVSSFQGGLLNLKGLQLGKSKYNGTYGSEVQGRGCVFEGYRHCDGIGHGNGQHDMRTVCDAEIYKCQQLRGGWRTWNFQEGEDWPTQECAAHRRRSMMAHGMSTLELGGEERKLVPLCQSCSLQAPRAHLRAELALGIIHYGE